MHTPKGSCQFAHGSPAAPNILGAIGFASNEFPRCAHHRDARLRRGEQTASILMLVLAHGDAAHEVTPTCDQGPLACTDAASSGIVLGGVAVPCGAELLARCNDTLVGAVVTRFCRRTCGVCDSQSLENVAERHATVERVASEWRTAVETMEVPQRVRAVCVCWGG